MLIHVGFEAAFDFAAPTTVLVMGNIHPTRTAPLRRLERLTVTPTGPINGYFDLYGNLCGRTTVPAGRGRAFARWRPCDQSIPLNSSSSIIAPNRKLPAEMFQ